jgi:hypothetical protein
MATRRMRSRVFSAGAAVRALAGRLRLVVEAGRLGTDFDGRFVAAGESDGEATIGAVSVSVNATAADEYRRCASAFYSTRAQPSGVSRSCGRKRLL